MNGHCEAIFTLRREERKTRLLQGEPNVKEHDSNAYLTALQGYSFALLMWLTR
jgi:hypothetical protein